jgi:hypothetical protein
LGVAMLNSRFPMKPLWSAPLREGDAPEGQGEYSVQSPFDIRSRRDP